MRSISHLIGGATSAYLGKKGLLFAKLLQSWPIIIGEQKARMAIPERVSFSKAKTTQKGYKTGATLYLSINSANAAILQHEKDMWKEKINLFLGQDAIGDIKFVHNKDIPSNQPRKMRRIERKPKLSEAQKIEIDEMLKDISDKNLKESLKNFAQSLYLDKDSK